MNSHFRSFRPKRNNPLHVMIQYAVRAGYNDRLAGAPWPRDIDQKNKAYQVNYENGRLMASNILAAGLRPPLWRDTTFEPRGLTEVSREASARVGSWRPTLYQEDQHAAS